MKRITAADNLIKMLEEAGYEAYYVGGCVRDFLMAKRCQNTCHFVTFSGDIDVTTSATPDEMKKVFAGCRYFETGIKHGTLTVMTHGEDGSSLPVEVTTFRTESGYSDSRHPDRVEFVRSLEEDLKRRDFTINAMAMDISGNVIDLYGGMDDLNAKAIRAVGDPDERFGEDALRIMRAMRFAAVLGGKTGCGAFAIEKKTEEAMLRNRQLLENISEERIYAELKKLVMGANAGDVIRKYVDILGVMMPELLAMKGFQQHNPYHRYDVLEHCIRAMEKLGETCTSPEDFPLKFAGLLHDVGKPETFFRDENGIGHMYGHPAAGEKLADRIMSRLKADNDTRQHVCSLVKHHDIVFEKDRKLLKRWMNRYTPELLLEILRLKRADNFATGNMSDELALKFDEIEQMIIEILEEGECFGLKNLKITGSDILEAAGADKGPGKWVGDVLGRLLEEVIDGSLENKKEALVKRAVELIGFYS